MHKLMATAAACSLGISLGMAAFAATDATAYERWLRVHNQTSYDLCYVHITHVARTGWGPDLLGSSCISPGYYMTVDPGWQQGYCKVDMKFIFSDGDEVIEWDYNICEGTDFYIN